MLGVNKLLFLFISITIVVLTNGQARLSEIRNAEIRNIITSIFGTGRDRPASVPLIDVLESLPDSLVCTFVASRGFGRVALRAAGAIPNLAINTGGRRKRSVDYETRRNNWWKEPRGIQLLSREGEKKSKIGRGSGRGRGRGRGRIHFQRKPEEVGPQNPDGGAPTEAPTTPETPGTTTAEATTPGATTPEATTPEATTPEATTPGETTPGETTPGATTPGATTPGGTTPGATTPGATTPEGTTPEGTTPGGTTPGATTPGATTPGATTPGATTPGATTPGATTPGATTPGATTPGVTTPETTTPVTIEAKITPTELTAVLQEIFDAFDLLNADDDYAIEDILDDMNFGNNDVDFSDYFF